MEAAWLYPDRAMLLHTIDLELSSYCNAWCVFCPRERLTREKSTMSMNCLEHLLQGIISVRPTGSRAAFFCGLGEPMLNSNIFKCSDLIGRYMPQTDVVIVSNGGLLDKASCDAMLTGNVHTFSCSMQSINKERYDELMRGPEYETVMQWLKYLAAQKKHSQLSVYVSYVQDDAEDANQDNKLFWDALGIPSGPIKQIDRGGTRWSEKGSRPVSHRKRCSLFNTRTFVAANGDVLACCHDLSGQSRLGTVGIDSLEAILDRKLEMINDGRLFPMCDSCNDVCAQS